MLHLYKSSGMVNKVLLIITTLLILLLTITPGSMAANRKARACLQPAESGNCFGYVPSYAYNPFERRCSMFVYGGCGGNENRFDSRATCEQSCRDV